MSPRYVWPDADRLVAEFQERTGLDLGTMPELRPGQPRCSTLPWPGCSDCLANALSNEETQVLIGELAYLVTSKSSWTRLRAAVDDLVSLRGQVDKLLDKHGGGAIGRYGNWPDIVIAQTIGDLIVYRGPLERRGGLNDKLIGQVPLALELLRRTLANVEIPPRPAGRPASPKKRRLELLVERLGEVWNPRLGRPLSDLELTYLLLAIGVPPWADDPERCANQIAQARP